jgi:D-alanyl-lipoteichoic acid acyltransferase DltB (MBOAT superfamily)
MIASASIDFIAALFIEKTEDRRKKKLFLTLSIVSNLGILGFFKYFNFFVDNFSTAFRFFGSPIDTTSLSIVLPIGISFYTFQALSYTIDVYKGILKPTRDPVAYFAFISFFPQLVAGPIERALHLLPQFYKPRVFDYAKAVDGSRQIIWGLFKKVVVADNCAAYANRIFDNYTDYSGSTLLVGAVLFAFQIYGDFSGYSDIAIGTGRLFGIDLNRNFAFPYFSRDIAEFWRRWHISLTTWFKDYVYIPLGGSRGSTWQNVRNVFVVFLLSGFWHGANWTFIVWGLLNAFYFLPSLLRQSNRKNLNIVASNRWLPSLQDFFSIVLTFFLTTVAWIFFRSESLTGSFEYLQRLFTPSLFSWPTLFPKGEFLWIGILIGVEWIQRNQQHGLAFEAVKWPRVVRWSLYYTLIAIIFWFAGRQQEFIYFQF